ncbi:MAG: phosphodiester glycosidase family protein, partial [Bradymonadaceae bacterium]
MKMIYRASLLVLLGWGVLLTSSTALAFNWTQAHPGVRHVQEVQSGPVRVNAMEVDLCAPGVSLRATKSGEGRRTTSSFGQLVGAQAAINGDFYDGSFRPIGLAIGAGERWPNNVDKAGWGFIAFGPQQAEISPTSAHVASPPSWMHDTVGGNILVLTNGTVTNDAGSFCTTRHPRTAAGFSQDGNKLYLAVVDGRTTSSRGMTCTELGQLMKNLGAHTAINLDGGGSTTMWVQGKGVVNVPSDGSQRTVANHLAVHATGSGTAKSCGQFDVDIDVNFLGLSNPLEDGDSENIPDVFVGDGLQSEILIQNRSPGVIRGVQAGYWIENPFIRATNYAIYTDHPHYDRQTWQLNDADAAPDNPPKDAMGAEGALTLHAFSPQETKRVLIDLEATRYSVGFSDHPDVRAWIRNIENVYGVQESFFGEPSNANHVGHILRAYDELDVLSRNEWQFQGRDPEQLEGWRMCDGSV